MKQVERKRVPAEQFTDRRLDAVIKPDDAETLYKACLLAVAARRGVPAEETPSMKVEAVQRVYLAGLQRGRREALAAISDDGK